MLKILDFCVSCVCLCGCVFGIGFCSVCVGVCCVLLFACAKLYFHRAQPNGLFRIMINNFNGQFKFDRKLTTANLNSPQPVTRPLVCAPKHWRAHARPRWPYCTKELNVTACPSGLILAFRLHFPACARALSERSTRATLNFF